MNTYQVTAYDGAAVVGTWQATGLLQGFELATAALEELWAVPELSLKLEGPLGAAGIEWTLSDGTHSERDQKVIITLVGLA